MGKLHHCFWGWTLLSTARGSNPEAREIPPSPIGGDLAWSLGGGKNVPDQHFKIFHIFTVSNVIYDPFSREKALF